jgi:hypothetical protein
MVRNPGSIWNAMVEPVKQDWANGEQTKAAGRVTFMVVETIVGTKGAGRAASVASAATRASEGAKAGEIATKASEGLKGTNVRGTVTSRGSFRKPTLQDAWDNAAPGPGDARLCPTCGRSIKVPPSTGIPRDWGASHFPSWTNRRM